MTYNDHLQSIKEYDLIAIIEELSNGKLVNTAVVISDVQWLIEQAEKAKRYERALKEINDFEGMTLYEAQSIAQEAIKDCDVKRRLVGEQKNNPYFSNDTT